jgi:hypothetical protein
MSIKASMLFRLAAASEVIGSGFFALPPAAESESRSFISAALEFLLAEGATNLLTQLNLRGWDIAG